MRILKAEAGVGNGMEADLIGFEPALDLDHVHVEPAIIPVANRSVGNPERFTDPCEISAQVLQYCDVQFIQRGIALPFYPSERMLTSATWHQPARHKDLFEERREGVALL